MRCASDANITYFVLDIGTNLMINSVTKMFSVSVGHEDRGGTGRTNRYQEVSSGWRRNHYRIPDPRTGIQKRMLIPVPTFKAEAGINIRKFRQNHRPLIIITI